MTINERVKYLRKEYLNLTQQDFADQLILGRATIAQIESGKINLTERNIGAICETFGVSENWLRTGEGEIIEPVDADEAFWAHFGELTKGDEEFMKELIMFMYNASPEERKIFKKMVKGLAAKDAQEHN